MPVDRPTQSESACYRYCQLVALIQRMKGAYLQSTTKSSITIHAANTGTLVPPSGKDTNA